MKFGLVLGILDNIHKALKALVLIGQNSEEQLELQFQLTCLTEIIKGAEDSSVSSEASEALEALSQKVADLAKYCTFIVKTKDLKHSVFNVGDHNSKVKMFGNSLQLLCTKLAIFLVLNTKEVDENNITRLDEVLMKYSKRPTLDILDNSDVKIVLLSMGVTPRQFRDIRYQMDWVTSRAIEHPLELPTILKLKAELCSRKKLEKVLEPSDFKYIANIKVDETCLRGSSDRARVYLLKWMGTEVAVKILEDVSFFDPGLKIFESMELVTRKNILNEIKLYDKLNVCPFISTFYGVSSINNKLAWITEFLPYKSIEYLIYVEPEQLTEGFTASLINGISNGLAHMHENGVTHFDVRSSNILVGRDWTPKITDIGIARIQKDSVNSIQWRAPEQLERASYKHGNHFPGDVYSFAVLLGEISTREKPWNECTLEAIQSSVLLGNRPYDMYLHNISPSIFSLMCKCWQQTPEARISMAQVLSYLESRCEEDNTMGQDRHFGSLPKNEAKQPAVTEYEVIELGNNGVKRFTDYKTDPKEPNHLAEHDRVDSAKFRLQQIEESLKFYKQETQSSRKITLMLNIPGIILIPIFIVGLALNDNSTMAVTFTVLGGIYAFIVAMWNMLFCCCYTTTPRKILKMKSERDKLLSLQL
eukprot:NODE_113_length_19319_cov_0.247815.p1 type:complete len:646 gc:universal NODE_113_length_19319_cov_0.247815:2422-4359(+)